jgi:flagellar biosynthesis protein FliR
MRIAVVVFMVLTRFAMVMVMPFVGMFLVRVRMRVAVAMAVVVSSMAVVSKTCHANQVYSQTQTADYKQLHQPFRFSPIRESLRCLNHNFNTY